MTTAADDYPIEPGAWLKRASLAGADLQGANLAGATLACDHVPSVCLERILPRQISQARG